MPPRRERGRVRLALDELLAGELGDRVAVAGRAVERVVLLGGGAGQRLEPVRVVGRAALHRPLAHRRGDGVGERGLERLALGDRRLELAEHAPSAAAGAGRRPRRRSRRTRWRWAGSGPPGQGRRRSGSTGRRRHWAYGFGSACGRILLRIETAALSLGGRAARLFVHVSKSTGAAFASREPMGQVKQNTLPPPSRGCDPDAAAGRLDDLLGDREPDPGPGVAARRRARAANMPKIRSRVRRRRCRCRCRRPRSASRAPSRDGASRRPRGSAPSAHELHGVGDQVGQQLLELARARAHDGQLADLQHAPRRPRSARSGARARRRRRARARGRSVRRARRRAGPRPARACARSPRALARAARAAPAGSSAP